MIYARKADFSLTMRLSSNTSHHALGRLALLSFIFRFPFPHFSFAAIVEETQSTTIEFLDETFEDEAGIFAEEYAEEVSMMHRCASSDQKVPSTRFYTNAFHLPVFLRRLGLP